MKIASMVLVISVCFGLKATQVVYSCDDRRHDASIVYKKGVETELQVDAGNHLAFKNGYRTWMTWSENNIQEQSSLFGKGFKNIKLEHEDITITFQIPKSDKVNKFDSTLTIVKEGAMPRDTKFVDFPMSCTVNRNE